MFGAVRSGRIMTKKSPEILEVDTSQLEELLRRAEGRSFEEEDYDTIQSVLESYVYVTGLLGDKKTSIARLRKLLFGPPTESSDRIMGTGNSSSSDQVASDESPSTSDETEPAAKPAGHGRNPAEAYQGGDQIDVPHESLNAGDTCPTCQQGTVYEVSTPGVLVRVVGQAPLHACVYHLGRFRCNLCGKVFTAEPPEAAGEAKYDATASSMIALLKYGSGLPFNRLEGLQRSMKIPLPASTQWDVVHAIAPPIRPAYEELIRQAAQGEVLHNDDTTVKILEYMTPGTHQQALDDHDDPSSRRTGLFTSGVVSTCDAHRVALFFSGRQHAGENLADVLKQRDQELRRPIQMCDALSRNLTGDLQTIVANCLAHGRRQFVEVYDRFPDECARVLEALKVVYRNEANAQKKKLSPEKRLRFHRIKSQQTMDRLHKWLTRQFDEKRVEPNSALGSAIRYMLKHWDKLTLFLREAGAPLDNNICERALKKTILHRKNSLFYKTKNGARVGDMFMSLIHTCELCQENPFDYLTELQRHADELEAQPADWMPWNYREALASHAE